MKTMDRILVTLLTIGVWMMVMTPLQPSVAFSNDLGASQSTEMSKTEHIRLIREALVGCWVMSLESRHSSTMNPTMQMSAMGKNIDCAPPK